MNKNISIKNNKNNQNNNNNQYGGYGSNNNSSYSNGGIDPKSFKISTHMKLDSRRDIPFGPPPTDCIIL